MNSARRLRIGEISIDVLAFSEAIDVIVGLVRAGRGGFVVTPNIDHVVLAEHNLEFREAYQRASLSLVDGQPLMWASRALGLPLPEKISGADLIEPLIERAEREAFRVYLFGAGPGVAERAGEVLREKYGVQICGTDAPMLSATPTFDEMRESLRKIRDAKPDLILVAMGAPKQEILMCRYAKDFAPAVTLGIGAGL